MGPGTPGPGEKQPRRCRAPGQPAHRPHHPRHKRPSPGARLLPAGRRRGRWRRRRRGRRGRGLGARGGGLGVARGGGDGDRCRRGFRQPGGGVGCGDFGRRRVRHGGALALCLMLGGCPFLVAGTVSALSGTHIRVRVVLIAVFWSSKKQADRAPIRRVVCLARGRLGGGHSGCMNWTPHLRQLGSAQNRRRFSTQLPLITK